MMNQFTVIMKEYAGDIRQGKDEELHNKTRKRNAITIKKCIYLVQTCAGDSTKN